MDFKKILMGLLSTAYKMDTEQIEAIFGHQTEDQLQAAILDADKNRVAELSKPKPGSTFQDGFAKGKKESLTELETAAKTKYGVNADVTGIELIDLIVKEKTPEGAAAVTEDAVKKHPIYQTLESKLTTAVAEKENEWKTKYDQRENELTANERRSKAFAKIYEQLDVMKPILSTNPTVAQNHKETFVKQYFGDIDFDFQANDRIIAMDKEGKVMQDAHGNTVLLPDLVKQKAPLFFEFQKNNGGNNAGNSNEENNGGGNNGSYSVPTTYEELDKILSDDKIPLEERNKIMEDWDKAQTA